MEELAAGPDALLVFVRGSPASTEFVKIYTTSLHKSVFLLVPYGIRPGCVVVIRTMLQGPIPGLFRRTPVQSSFDRSCVCQNQIISPPCDPVSSSMNVPSVSEMQTGIILHQGLSATSSNEPWPSSRSTP